VVQRCSGFLSRGVPNSAIFSRMDAANVDAACMLSFLSWGHSGFGEITMGDKLVVPTL
jgi:hypothetical protein